MKNVARPVVRYHGGKWKLAPWIISHFPEHRIYTEAYCGAASVLMRKKRSYAEIVNDMDDEIVNVFRVLRDDQESKKLEELLRLTPFARSEFTGACARDIEIKCNIENARQTIIKAYMGFGSSAIKQPTGFRSDSNRSGTTPAHDWANYPSHIDSFVKRLQGVVIENRKAVDVIRHHDRADTLHYVDPPYLKSTRTDDGDDYGFEMTEDQHSELSAVLRAAQGMVVLSGYPSELYNDFYSNWHRVDRKAFADGARERTECLWLNDNAYKALSQRRLFD